MSDATFSLMIDGTEVQATPGDTLLDVTRRLGIEVPTLCHEDRVDPMGSCRMCLVEIDGQRRLQPSCAFAAGADMVVHTHSDRVKRHRQLLLSMYLADHELDEDDLPRERGTGNQLRQHVEAHGVGPTFTPIAAPRGYREDLNPNPLGSRLHRLQERLARSLREQAL